MSVAQRPSGRGASRWSRRGRRALAPSPIGRCGPWSPTTAGAPEQGEADIRGRAEGREQEAQPGAGAGLHERAVSGQWVAGVLGGGDGVDPGRCGQVPATRIGG